MTGLASLSTSASPLPSSHRTEKPCGTSSRQVSIIVVVCHCLTIRLIGPLDLSFRHLFSSPHMRFSRSPSVLPWIRFCSPSRVVQNYQLACHGLRGWNLHLAHPSSPSRKPSGVIQRSRQARWLRQPSRQNFLRPSNRQAFHGRAAKNGRWERGQAVRLWSGRWRGGDFLGG